MFSLMLAAAVAVVPAGKTFSCNAIRVWDGDGPIWCAEGPRIRLHNIAARELDDTCRKGHPCPARSGIAARDHLVRLLGGAKGLSREGHVIVSAKLTCRSYGWGKGSRTAAACACKGVDLSRAMVRDGFAAAWNR